MSKGIIYNKIYKKVCDYNTIILNNLYRTDCCLFTAKFTTVTVIRNILCKVQFSNFVPKTG